MVGMDRRDQEGSKTKRKREQRERVIDCRTAQIGSWWWTPDQKHLTSLNQISGRIRHHLNPPHPFPKPPPPPPPHPPANRGNYKNAITRRQPPALLLRKRTMTFSSKGESQQSTCTCLDLHALIGVKKCSFTGAECDAGTALWEFFICTCNWLQQQVAVDTKWPDGKCVLLHSPDTFSIEAWKCFLIIALFSVISSMLWKYWVSAS